MQRGITEEVYNFRYLTKEGKTEIIALGTEEAKDWMAKHKDALDDAMWIGLVPTQSHKAGRPPVLDVFIPPGMHYIYYRRVTGVLSSPDKQSGPTSVTYVLGWTDGVGELVLEATVTEAGVSPVRMIWRRKEEHGSDG